MTEEQAKQGEALLKKIYLCQEALVAFDYRKKNGTPTNLVLHYRPLKKEVYFQVPLRDRLTLMDDGFLERVVLAAERMIRSEIQGKMNNYKEQLKNL